MLGLKRNALAGRVRSPVSGRGDEVEAAVDARVRVDLAVDARLCVQVLLVLILDEVGDRLPAGWTDSRARG